MLTLQIKNMSGADRERRKYPKNYYYKRKKAKCFN